MIASKSQLPLYQFKYSTILKVEEYRHNTSQLAYSIINLDLLTVVQNMVLLAEMGIQPRASSK